MSRSPHEVRALRVAFGFAPHSGWAALVVVGRRGREFVALDRRRIELVDDAWAKAPYHAAEGLAPEAARELVERGVAAAQHVALRELRAALVRERARAHEVAACGLIAGSAMPAWSVEEIRAVHFRMHKAEGALFRDALARASEACGLRLVAIPEPQLSAQAGSSLVKTAATLGKALGPPWGKDQKNAALVAMVALGG